MSERESVLEKWLGMMGDEDWLDFPHFLEHSQWKDRKLLKELFQYYLRHHTKSVMPDGKDDAYRILYPGEPFIAQRLRRVEMELRQAIETFQASKEHPIISKDWDHRLRILQVLRRNGHFQLLNKKLEENLTWLKEKAPFMQDFHLVEMWLYQLKGEIAIQQQLSNAPFIEVGNSLEQYYLHRKLETWMSSKASGIPMPQGWEHELQIARTRVGENPSPILQIWTQVALLESDDASSLQKLDELLQIFGHRIPPMSLRQIRGYQMNYMIQTGNLGEVEYYEGLWKLVRAMVQEGSFYLENGAISIPFYLQAIRTGCLAREIEWTRTFNESEKEKVVGNHREEYLNYGNMLLLFGENRFGHVWQALLTLQTDDIKLDAFCRILQIQTAYHLEKAEEVFRLSENLRRFLGRHHELGDRFIKMSLEFVKWIEKVGHWKFDGLSSKAELYAMICQCQSAEKLWLKSVLE